MYGVYTILANPRCLQDKGLHLLGACSDSCKVRDCIYDWLWVIRRVGQNRIYTPYMTVYLVISLPKMPYIHRIYMVLANPSHTEAVMSRYTTQEFKESNEQTDNCYKAPSTCQMYACILQNKAYMGRYNISTFR
jgi:hypothetical protein